MADDDVTPDQLVDALQDRAGARAAASVLPQSTVGPLLTDLHRVLILVRSEHASCHQEWRTNSDGDPYLRADTRCERCKVLDTSIAAQEHELFLAHQRARAGRHR